uniref:SFRICE_033900 n=1 Tax=Spodoptera frugiperda TaxID=7108 RepID=A0A2H1W1B5_SPOFR
MASLGGIHKGGNKNDESSLTQKNVGRKVIQFCLSGKVKMYGGRLAWWQGKTCSGFDYRHGATLCVIHKLLFRVWVSCVCELLFISLGRAGLQYSGVFMVVSTVDPGLQELQRYGSLWRACPKKNNILADSGVELETPCPTVALATTRSVLLS